MLDFRTLHGVTGEILVCEMNTRHSGPARGSLRADTTPAGPAVGRPLAQH